MASLVQGSLLRRPSHSCAFVGSEMDTLSDGRFFYISVGFLNSCSKRQRQGLHLHLIKRFQKRYQQIVVLVHTEEQASVYETELRPVLGKRLLIRTARKHKGGSIAPWLLSGVKTTLLLSEPNGFVSNEEYLAIVGSSRASRMSIIDTWAPMPPWVECLHEKNGRCLDAKLSIDREGYLCDAYVFDGSGQKFETFRVYAHQSRWWRCIRVLAPWNRALQSALPIELVNVVWSFFR